MSLTNFLVERCLETLDAAGCRYQRLPSGRVHCECDDPIGPVVKQTIERVDLINWCGSTAAGGDAFLRVLADLHATHRDYQPEWDQIGSASSS